MRAAILLVPFAADIALKILARMNPDALGRFSFSPSVGTIGFAPSVNTVLAFSLPVPNAVIWPIGWIIVAALIWSGVRCQPAPTGASGVSGVRMAITAVLLGALSNLTDRTVLGGVTDYLSFTNLFPAFNLADLLIIGGIIGWMRASAWHRSAAAVHGASRR